MSKLTRSTNDTADHTSPSDCEAPRLKSAKAAALPLTIPAPPKSVQDIKDFAARHGELKPPPAQHALSKDGVGTALSDTPLPSHPGSPKEYV